MTDINDHDQMLRRLGGLITRTDPVPPQVTLAARAAIAWRRMDAEIAELLFDSATEEALAGTRGVTGGVRQLTFEAPSGACVEMEVLPGIERCVLLGQVLPPGDARVFVRHADGVEDVTADDLGRFRVEGVARGHVSLRCTLPDGTVFQTGWTHLP